MNSNPAQKAHNPSNSSRRSESRVQPIALIVARAGSFIEDIPILLVELNQPPGAAPSEARAHLS